MVTAIAISTLNDHKSAMAMARVAIPVTLPNLISNCRATKLIL